MGVLEEHAGFVTGRGLSNSDSRDSAGEKRRNRMSKEDNFPEAGWILSQRLLAGQLGNEHMQG